MQVTPDFINKRIAEQFDYIFYVLTSDRTRVRKQELVESATAVMSSLLNHLSGDPHTAMFVLISAQQFIHRMQHWVLSSKPKEYFKPGGVDVRNPACCCKGATICIYPKCHGVPAHKLPINKVNIATCQSCGYWQPIEDNRLTNCINCGALNFVIS